MESTTLIWMRISPIGIFQKEKIGFSSRMTATPTIWKVVFHFPTGPAARTTPSEAAISRISLSL